MSADKDNYYLFKGCIIGAPRTGTTTFINQVMHGKPDGDASLTPVSYKEYNMIGGKSKIKLQLSGMPDEIIGLTSGYFKSQAILFIFFDLSRPETFYEIKAEGN